MGATYGYRVYEITDIPVSGVDLFIDNILRPDSVLITTIERAYSNPNPPGEFLIGATLEANATNLAAALQADYGPGSSANLAIDVTSSGADVIISFTEYGYNIPSNPFTGDFYRVKEDVKAQLIGQIDVESSQFTPPCTNAKFTFTAPLLTGADFPVQITSPVIKTCNSSTDFYFEFARYTNPAGVLTIETAQGFSSSEVIPRLTKYAIGSVSTDLNGNVTINSQVVVAGDINSTLLYSIDGVNYFPDNNFPNVPEGAYTAYLQDEFNCIETAPFIISGLELPPIVSFVQKDQSATVKVKYSNPTGIDNLRINIYINIPRTGALIKKTMLPLEVAPDEYEAEFEINNVLWGEISNYLDNIDKYPTYDVPFFTFPADPDNLIVKHDELLLDYFIDTSYNYADSEGNVIEAGKTDNEGDNNFYRNAFMGGVSRDFQAYLASEEITLIDYFRQGYLMKFATWIPDNLPVHPRQPARLWLINPYEISGLNLIVTVYYTDGTSETRNIDSVAESIGVWEICCGPSELRLSSIDITKTVASYDVWIAHNTLIIKTEKKKFIIDYKYYERNDIIFFKTSLGVYEVLWAHGDREESHEVERKQSDRPLKTPALGKGTIFAERGRYTVDYGLNTGFFPKALRHWLTDFTLSDELCLPANYVMNPLVLTSKRDDFSKDREDLFALDFSMSVAHLESHYSKVPDGESPWGDFNNDFNNDYYT